MMKLTFYKNNRIDGEYNIAITQLLKDYKQSKWKKIDWPFERSFLAFLSEKNPNDTWDISKKQWDYIYKNK